MRVPIPIVVTLSISVALTVWFVATRKMNFAQEPTPAEYVQILEQWEQIKPHIRPVNSAESRSAEAQSDKISQLVTHHLKKTAEHFPKVEPKIPPTLAEHGVLQKKGSAYMCRYAAHLESAGHTQHALLAWERVIDTTNPDENQRHRAITSIKRLKYSLPPLSTIPEVNRPMTLHVGASINDANALQAALEIVAKSIEKASGRLIRTTTHLSLAKNHHHQAKPLPMALWLSRPTSSGESDRLETTPVSFTADPNDEQALTRELYTSIYEIIRKNLALETGFSKLPERPVNIHADELVQFHITRLMWREFFNTMKN